MDNIEHIGSIDYGHDPCEWEEDLQEFTTRTHLRRILSLVGKNVREITLDTRDDCLDLLNYFTLVQELTLEIWDHIKVICCLKRLTKISLKCISEGNMETRRVMSLPKLVHIDLNLNFKFSLRFDL